MTELGHFPIRDRAQAGLLCDHIRGLSIGHFVEPGTEMIRCKDELSLFSKYIVGLGGLVFLEAFAKLMGIS